MPWVKLLENREDDNYESLRTLDWQVHVYGDASPELSSFCKTRDLALQLFPWRDAMTGAGLAQNALYLLRPDGDVGYAAERAGIDGLFEYVEAWVLRTRQANAVDKRQRLPSGARFNARCTKGPIA